MYFLTILKMGIQKNYLIFISVKHSLNLNSISFVDLDENMHEE